ncbi:hypothetical protein [Agromyces archimandritae]|uniref:DUF559 domain-containing protein n=1 Tax=Agromyces archimandritae TaxID=2781962 RepID=A0A975FKF4_9MICO|nr:hypothetical protein [Agromyces archimandritae]QTX03714.1 hypothetical protein G127AT_10250 [Agromyces archimandritae]
MRSPSPLPTPFRAQPFSTRDALAAGVRSTRLRAGDLRAPFSGTRVPSRADPSFVQRCRALAAVMEEHHVFAGPTAARLYGIPLPAHVDRDETLHVLSIGGRRAMCRNGVAGSTTAAVPATVPAPGIRTRMTTAADTWCALGAMLAQEDLVIAGDRLIGLPRPLADPRQIDAAIERHGSRRGSRALAAARGAMRAGSFSPRESRTRLRIARAGLPEPELNARIVLSTGRWVRGDLVFRVFRVLLEYEGEHHLTDARQWAIDIERYNDLVADGWQVIRVTKAMSETELVARVTRALRVQGWPPASR